MFAAAEEIFVAHGGRPHWGTVHTQDAEYLRSLYPRFQDFLDARVSVNHWCWASATITDPSENSTS